MKEPRIDKIKCIQRYVQNYNILHIRASWPMLRLFYQKRTICGITWRDGQLLPSI